MHEWHTALVLVLERIPTQQRLTVCGLVSQAWRAAANACCSIHATLRHHQALQHWLAKYGASTSIKLTVAQDPQKPSYKQLRQIPFPCSMLKNLKSLEVCSAGIVKLDSVQQTVCSATPQQQQQQLGSASLEASSLADALVHLTVLCLSQVHVDGWLQAVPALTQNLRDLTLREARGTGSQLHLLTALTALDYAPAGTESVPARRFGAISRLTRLQHLSLGMPATAPPAVLSEALSAIQQVTGLESLSFRALQFHLTTETASKLFEPLTALTGLTLYCKCDVVSLSDLKSLQYLDVSKAQFTTGNPSDFQALTASSDLRQLHVGNFCGSPHWLTMASCWQEMSGADQLMPWLHTLTVRLDLSNVYQEGGNMWVPDQPCTVLERIALCCPNLQRLDITNTSFYPAQLNPLSSLTRLTGLQLAVDDVEGSVHQQPREVSFMDGTGRLQHGSLKDHVEASAAADTLQNTLIQLLVGLTALESLTVDYYYKAPVLAGTTEAAHLQCLTGLTYLCLPLRQFTDLTDEEREYWRPVHVYLNQAPEGSPPDVYQQLQLPVTPLYRSIPWRQAYKDAEREAQEFESLASDVQWYCEQLAQLFDHDFVLHDRFWGQQLSKKWSFGKGRSHLLCAGKASGWRHLQGVRFTTQRVHNELAQSYSRSCGSGAWLRGELSGDALVRQLTVPDSSVVTEENAVMYRKLRYNSVPFGM